MFFEHTNYFVGLWRKSIQRIPFLLEKSNIGKLLWDKEIYPVVCKEGSALLNTCEGFIQANVVQVGLDGGTKRTADLTYALGLLLMH